MPSYTQTNITANGLIKRHLTVGIINSSTSDTNFPGVGTYFFIAISDYWSIGIFAFPYGRNQASIYYGQYDLGAKTWTWTAK